MATVQELIAEFHRRRIATATGPVAGRESASDEIGLALTLAPHAGALRVAAADRLAGVLRPTRDLLQAGRLSPDRARLVTDMLWAYDDEIAAAVQERVLPRAPGMTWGQLRAALTRAILAVVPDAGHRHRAARRERRVDLYPGEDGMATLAAWLTATEATASFEWVTRLARGVVTGPATDGQDGTGGSARGRGSMDRRRADVLVALLTGRLVATAADAAAMGATTTTCRPSDRPTDRPAGRTAGGRPSQRLSARCAVSPLGDHRESRLRLCACLHRRQRVPAPVNPGTAHDLLTRMATRALGPASPQRPR